MAKKAQDQQDGYVNVKVNFTAPYAHFYKIGFDFPVTFTKLDSDLRLLPRFLPTQCGSCIVPLGFFMLQPYWLNRFKMAGSNVSPTNMQVATPMAMIQPRLSMPLCLARIKLPKPAIVVNPETSTAFPVLRARMLGFCSSANRFRM